MEQRKGAMPEPRSLVLNPVSQATPEIMFWQFMQAFNGRDPENLKLPSGDLVRVDVGLFTTLDGRWKISKRGRDQWLLYLAEMIKNPQEIWQLKQLKTEELYLMGRFQRGRMRLDALAVFKRDGDFGVWDEGKTGFVADFEDYLDQKRSELSKKKAQLVWTEV